MFSEKSKPDTQTKAIKNQLLSRNVSTGAETFPQTSAYRCVIAASSVHDVSSFSAKMIQKYNKIIVYRGNPVNPDGNRVFTYFTSFGSTDPP